MCLTLNITEIYVDPTRLLKIVAFIPAFLTAISRVYQNYHWTSDVFLGAMIGYFTGKFITDLHKETELSGQINHAPILSLKLSF